MSETKSRSRYNYRPDRSEGSRSRDRDDRSLYDRQDPRYAYDYRDDPRDRYRMSEYERERYRQEMYRREEMYRRGLHPDDYVRNYQDRYYRDASRNYPGYKLVRYRVVY
jgi:hypothetical protein